MKTNTEDNLTTKIGTFQEHLRKTSPPKDILTKEWHEARIKGDWDTLSGIEKLKFREVERENERWLEKQLKRFG